MKQLIALFIVSIVSIVSMTPGAALGNNPFAPGTSRLTTPGPEKAPAVSNPLVERMVMFQYTLKQKITLKVRQAKADKGIKPLFVLALLAFFYGVLHAAGPGHGKAVATLYLLSRGRALGNGLLLGNLIALFHALSAVFLVVVLRQILDVSITGSFTRTTLIFQKISYALIALMGTGLLVRKLINWRRLKHRKTPFQTLFSGRSIFALAFFTGMVPCPRVLLIMLFTMSLDMIWLGVVLSMFTAVGMGLTISAVVMVVLKGKTLALVRIKQRPGFTKTLELSFELAGAHMVTCLGFFMLGALIAP